MGPRAVRLLAKRSSVCGAGGYPDLRLMEADHSGGTAADSHGLPRFPCLEIFRHESTLPGPRSQTRSGAKTQWLRSLPTRSEPRVLPSTAVVRERSRGPSAACVPQSGTPFGRDDTMMFRRRREVLRAGSAVLPLWLALLDEGAQSLLRILEAVELVQENVLKRTCLNSSGLRRCGRVRNSSALTVSGMLHLSRPTRRPWQRRARRKRTVLRGPGTRTWRWHGAIHARGSSRYALRCSRWDGPARLRRHWG